MLFRVKPIGFWITWKIWPVAKCPETLISLTPAGDCTVTMELYYVSTVLPSLLTPVLIHEAWNILPILLALGLLSDSVFPVEGEKRMDSTYRLRLYDILRIALLLWQTPWIRGLGDCCNFQVRQVLQDYWPICILVSKSLMILL